MARRKKQHGITEVSPGRFVVQVQVDGKRQTTRVNGTMAQAEEARAQLLLKGRAQSQRNEGLSYQGGTETRAIPLNPESPEPRNSSPTLTLAEWLTDRYSRWQLTSQNETTRRKLETPKRYLIASDLGSLALSKIGTADINAYIEWRHKIGALTFARRKDGNRYRPRVGECSSQTINKSLKILSTALHLAHDEEVIANIPKINYLPEDDARTITPPPVEQYNELIRAAEILREEAALLPEVIELLGEFGLRPGELFNLTWQSIDWELGQGENKGAIRIEEQKRTRVVGGKRWVPKNKKFRIVPFTARGRAVLLRIKEMAPGARPEDLVIPNNFGLPYIRIDCGPMKGGGAGIWKKLREASGVEGVAMRDLRHFFAVQNLVRGVPISVVSAWMGHSSIELTVKRYGRWAGESKEQWTWAALRGQSVGAVASGGR